MIIEVNYMYTINFFTLEKSNTEENTFIENLLNYELSLSTLDDIKSFLSSEFYANTYEYLFEFMDGIVITDKNNEVIYKEMFNTDTLFDVYKDEEGNNIYKAIGAIEDDYCNYLMEDKHKLYYR
jgi:hypothetical protein